jgi:tetratricopeptide (TPR) repeat protein
VAPTPRIELPLADYVAFLRAARSAEQAAREAGRGLWGSEEHARVRHLEAAQRLRSEGDHAAALSELRAVIAAGGENPQVWIDVGRCHEQLGQWDEALAAYDTAIGDGGWYQPYHDRARCLRRARGLEAAVEWLRGLAEESPEDHKFPHILGSFLRECGKYERAIPPLQRAVDLVSARHAFRFEADGWLILDDETLARSNNDYADLWPTLEYLAACQYAEKDADAALRTATMGVSIGQQINRCKGYYDATEVEAGDAACRIWRARILMDREDWDLARSELALARALTEHSGYRPRLDEIADLEDRLKSRRIP